MEKREIERELKRLELDLEDTQDALDIVWKERAEILNKMNKLQEELDGPEDIETLQKNLKIISNGKR
jgi:uncharacterized protein YoxC